MNQHRSSHFLTGRIQGDARRGSNLQQLHTASKDLVAGVLITPDSSWGQQPPGALCSQPQTGIIAQRCPAEGKAWEDIVKEIYSHHTTFL